MTQKLVEANLAEKREWTRGMRHLKKNDPALAKIIDRLGPYEFRLDDDHYEALVGSIIFQQLAGAAARAILNRFKQIYNGRIPRPRQYLDTEEKRLRASGLSPQKIGYIRDLSERVEDGVLNLKKLSHLPSEEVVKELDDVKGIGRWTAEMFLIFHELRADVLPVDDIGLQRAIAIHFNDGERLPREAMFAVADLWRPWRSVATWYLWRSLDPIPVEY